MDQQNVITTIRELHRQRQDLHRAEKSLTLQIKACCRHACDKGPLDKDDDGKKRMKVMKDGGDKLYKALHDELAHDLYVPMYAALSPFFHARETIKTARTGVEKKLEKQAKKLEVAPIVESIRGLGFGSLGALIGEAGDLSNYATISRLWKRMGVAVVGTIRQQRVSGEDAITHGFSPQRRAVLWNIGNGLIGCMGHGPRPAVGEDISGREDLTEYQKLFIRQCREEVAKNPDMGRPHVQHEKSGELRESYSAHASARAKRYVEKRFLLDLWRAWNRVECEVDPELRAAA